MATVEECPGSLIYSPTVRSCVEGNRETCELGSVTTFPPTTSPIITTTEVQTTVDLDAICENIFIGVFPYPSNCAKFIVCMQFEAEIAECREGTIFDADIGRCALGDPVTCELDSSATDTSTIA